MKKVAFIINTLEFGGAERHTVNLANELVEKGNEITLFVLKNQVDLKNELDPRIKLEIIGISKFYDSKKIKKLRDICIKNDIDKLFCVNPFTLMYGYKALKNSGIKVIIIHHTTELRDTKSKIKNIYFRRLINKCDYKIFVSSNQQSYWNKKYKINLDNSCVIRNGINLERFNINSCMEKSDIFKLKKELKIKKDDLVIIYSAMLRPEKNHLKFLDNIKKIIDRGHKNIVVLLLGEGKQRSIIENFILNNNLEKYVHLLGKKHNVGKYYLLADIGVIASYAVETFSIAALEQMSMEIPMLMTNIGGANEMLIDEFNGFLYNVNDNQKFITNIEQIYLNRDILHKMKRNARLVVENNFSQKAMVEKYQKIIEEILD